MHRGFRLRGFRLQGPLARVGVGLAALLGLAVMIWLFTTLWLLLVAGGLIGGAIGLWRRFQSQRYIFGPRRWRKVTRGSLEPGKNPHHNRVPLSKDRYRP